MKITLKFQSTKWCFLKYFRYTLTHPCRQLSPDKHRLDFVPTNHSFTYYNIHTFHPHIAFTDLVQVKWLLAHHYLIYTFLVQKDKAPHFSLDLFIVCYTHRQIPHNFLSYPLLGGVISTQTWVLLHPCFSSQPHRYSSF